MGLFCLLNNILYWTDYDEDGNYKYTSLDNLKKEEEKLQEELKKYDITRDDDVSTYLTIHTKLDLIKLKKQFPSTSWQYRKIDTYMYQIVYQLNYCNYKKEAECIISAVEEEYTEVLEKFKQDDWKYFLEKQKDELKERQKDIESQLSQVTIQQEKSDLEQSLSETKQQIKILTYRLENNIKEDSSYLNVALEAYQENKQIVMHYQELNKNLNRQEELEYRDALKKMKINQYIVNHRQNINKQNNLNYQLRTIVEDYEIFIVILILIIGSTIICDEFRDGTIKLLLIKPYSRGKILISKYFASIVVLAISVIFLILLQLIVGGFIFGFDSLDIPVVVYHFKLAKIVTYPVFSYMFIRILAKLPLLFMLLTISILLGILFSSNVVSITIPLLLYMFSFSLRTLAVQYHIQFMRYLVTMNWNFQDYLFGGISDFSLINFQFSCIIWIIYFIIIVVLTFICFKKKNIRNI